MSQTTGERLKLCCLFASSSPPPPSSPLQIHYFALISQSTGEDWDDAPLALSTSLPSIGGSPPDLGTQKFSFKKSYHVLCAEEPPPPLAVSAAKVSVLVLIALRASSNHDVLKTTPVISGYVDTHQLIYNRDWEKL